MEETYRVDFSINYQLLSAVLYIKDAPENRKKTPKGFKSWLKYIKQEQRK